MNSAADPTAALYQHLQSSGLLTAAQLRELWGWIAHQKPDVRRLAQELHRRNWLTPFQIREIAKGRGAGLKIADRYNLQDILGEGGMGRVYKAHDTRMGRDVAFKVIRKEKLSNPAAVARFEQEILALSRMSKHPNVVEVLDAAKLGDNHYCVMEYIEGTDLTKIVRDRGPMHVSEACDAIRQAALGLQHAFETGLVHRDIKPSNILVSRNGWPVKLVDLGLARVIDEPGNEEKNRLTQEGFVIGTPDFLAPEQARNPMGVDIRADIYSLGGTLFYLLTGRVPYEGANPTEKLLKHCTEAPPSLLPYRPDAPPALDQIVRWCMAKQPGERPQTPIQLAMALQPFCPPPAPGTGAFAVPNSGHYPALPSSPMPAGAISGGMGGMPPVPPGPYPFPGGPPPAGSPRAPLPVPAAVPAPYSQPPVYAPPGVPLPLPDPTPSSQVFKLPPQSTDNDPIRRRGEGRFPLGILLISTGTLFVIAVLAFATYRVFLRSDPGPPEPFTNSFGMKMAKLEGGTYHMGSPGSEPGRHPDEGPVHEVTIRGPFFMSVTEVTNGQFVRVMGVNPARATRIAAHPDHLPVDSVTWEEANEFCRKLTEKEKGQDWMRKGWEYRLPTEAEWEYACRAGTDSPMAFGERAAFGTQAVYRPDNNDPLDLSNDQTKPPMFGQEVGKTEPNKFGLCDMHGNIAEWCRDWYRSEAYKDTTRENPTGPTDGDKRVIRGGSFRDPASATRSAARAFARPTERLDKVGFRIIYAPVQK